MYSARSGKWIGSTVVGVCWSVVEWSDSECSIGDGLGHGGTAAADIMANLSLAQVTQDGYTCRRRRTTSSTVIYVRETRTRCFSIKRMISSKV
jgi:hypothetical protein